jgi:hypothetical protein
MKDDGHYKSVNTFVLWFKNAPFIFAGQSETCFYLEDGEFGLPWKIVQTFSNRNVFDVPEREFGNEIMGEENLAYQDDICTMDHNINYVIDDDDEVEVDVEDADRRDELEHVDERYDCDLEKEDNNNEDIELSEDEHVYTMEDTASDAEARNSDYDTNVER